VPNELDSSHAASSVRAQAIAARTYGYYQINIYGALNNSNQRQVYIPYSYDSLSTAHKAVIDQALAGQVYLSLPGSTDPIAAYFSDNIDA
jgi:peptidoglycan hydrolase-like amidase